MQTPVLRSIAVAFVSIAWIAFPVVAADLEVPGQFASIQSAIDAASVGDRVVVAPGTYVETIDFLGKSIAVVSSQGPEATIIDGGGVGSVVTFQSTGSEALLLGFTLTGGVGTTIQTLQIGGGILLLGASPRIEANVIEGCAAWNGGGIACLGGASPRIAGNTFRNNDAYSLGGAIHCDEASRADILSNRIHGNRSASGFAITIVGGSSPFIQGNLFYENEFGAIYALNGHAAVIAGNEFRDHSGHAVAIVESNEFRIEDNRVAGLNDITGLHVTSCRELAILRNVLDEQGVRLYQCSGVDYEANHMIGSTLQMNVCDGVRVASSVFTESTQSRGEHAVHVLQSSAVLVHCTVLYEGGPDGAVSILTGSTVSLLNTIVWGDVAPFQVSEGATLTARGCNIRGGFPGEDNIAIDPRVVFGDGEFHLRRGSACIDAGVHGEGAGHLDIDGDPRVVGAKADIGADEFVHHIAARYGHVNRQAEPVLFVNGFRGDHRRRIRISRTEPLEIALGISSAGPSSARHAMYAWLSEPDEATARLQPHSLGWMAFPTPLQMEQANQPVAIWNTLGRPGKLGRATHPSDPAPTVLIGAPWGTRVPMTFTLQGFIQDAGSQAQGPVSVTNAVVVVAD